MTPALWFAAAAAGIAVLAVLWKLLRPRKQKSWIQTTRCPSCGWSGQTSTYAGRCPRCNTPIGDQRGKRV